MSNYCPRCGSKLYPADVTYMELHGICSYCYTYKKPKPIYNPNCDGTHCIDEQAETRLLPTGGDGNLILCHACFSYEIAFRIERNKNLSKENMFSTPGWLTLKVYKERGE